MAGNRLEVEIGAKMTELTKTLRKASDDLNKFAGKAQEVGEKMTKAGKAMTLGITAPLIAIGGLTVKAAADFEKLKTALNSSFQGNKEAANSAYETIKEFATKTPYQLEEVTSAFIKLKNYGLEPTMDSLTSYGNTASAMGKDLNQMIEAVADAATGEFERLKEFGIKAKKEGDRVTFTFRGVATEVGNSASEIQKYLMNIGNVDFAGAMEDQSKTFYGRLSTMKDDVKFAMADLGDILIETLAPLMTTISDLAKSFQDLSPEVKKTILVIGGLAAAIGPLLLTLGVMSTTVIPALAAGFSLLTTATSAFTTALLANPIGAIAVAITAFIGVLYWAVTRTVELTDSTYNLKKATDKATESAKKYQQIDKLKGKTTEETISLIEAEKKAVNDRVVAYATQMAQYAEGTTQRAKYNALILEETNYYNSLTAEIEKLKAGVVDLKKTVDGTNPFEGLKQGTVAWLEVEKRLLTEQQEKVSTSAEQWVMYGNKILEVQNKINAISITPPTADFSQLRSGGSMFGSMFFKQDELDAGLASFTQFAEDLKVPVANVVATMETVSVGIGSALNSAATSAISGMAQIAGALMSGQMKMSQVGDAMLKMIGGIISQLGEAVLAAGMAGLAIDLAITNPWAAIAAGAALIALGAAIGAAQKAVTSDGSGGGGTTRGSGGSGSTQMSGSSGSYGTTQSQNQTVVFELYGTKLIGVIRNTLARDSSLGGSLNLTP